MADPAPAAMDPKQQLQVHDEVLFFPAGVYARITGYRWYEQVGHPPTIAAYVLDIGIEVPGRWLQRVPARPQ